MCNAALTKWPFGRGAVVHHAFKHSESYRFAFVSGYPSPSLHVSVGVAVLSTLLATTELHVPELGSWGGGASQLRAKGPESAARREAESWRTLCSATLTWSHRALVISDAWRSSPMVSPFLEGHSLQWTQRWYRFSTATAHHILGLPMWMELSLPQPDGGRRERTQNSQGLAAEPVWSFLQERLGGRWSEETRRFLSLLAKAKARSKPPILKKRAEQAWRLR